MTNPLLPYLAPLPLFAVLRGITPEEIPSVGAALAAEGFRILEVPLNSPRAFDSIRALAALHGEHCLVGAGTVLTTSDVAGVAAAGGRLIVMPHADPAVIREAKRLGLCCVPGVATPTEAFRALAAGADGLKMFPADQLPRCAQGVARRPAARHAAVPRGRDQARQHGALLGRGRGRFRDRVEPVPAGRRRDGGARRRRGVCQRVSRARRAPRRCDGERNALKSKRRRVPLPVSSFATVSTRNESTLTITAVKPGPAMSRPAGP